MHAEGFFMPNRNKNLPGVVSGDMNMQEIARWIIPGEIGSQIEIHQEIGSTNTRAKELAV